MPDEFIAPPEEVQTEEFITPIEEAEGFVAPTEEVVKKKEPSDIFKIEFAEEEKEPTPLAVTPITTETPTPIPPVLELVPRKQFTLREYIKDRDIHPSKIGLDPLKSNLDRNLRPGELENLDAKLGRKAEETSSYFWGTARAINEGTESFFRTLDNAMITLSDITGIPKGDTFSAAADLVHEIGVKGRPVTPKGFVGDVLKEGGHLSGLFLELWVTPGLKYGKAVFGASKIPLAMPKIITQLTASNFFNTYGELTKEDVGSQRKWQESFEAAGHGAIEGAKLVALGYGSGYASRVAKELGASKGLEILTRTTAMSAGFAGLSAAEQWLETGIVDLQQVAVSGTIGALFSIPEVSDHLYGKAVNNFMLSSPGARKAAREIELTPEELRSKSAEILLRAEKETDIEKKDALVTEARVIDAITDIKVIDKQAELNPEEFEQGIRNSELSPEVTEAFIDKLNEIKVEKDPVATQANEIASEVTQIKNDMAKVKTNKALTPEVREAQVELFEEAIEGKKQKIKELLKPKEDAGKIKETTEDVREKERIEREEAPEVKEVEKIEPFVTKSGNQTVEFKQGKLVVLDKAGKEPSVTTKRKAIREYEDQFDFKKGEKVTEVTEQDPDRADQEIIQKTSNPQQLAEIFQRQSEKSRGITEDVEGSREDIMAEILNTSVKRQSFIDFADESLIGRNIAKGYKLSKEGELLDVLSEDAIDRAGVEITPQDLVDFMLKYPQGADQYLREVKRNPVVEDAKDKFRELTGMELNERTARKALEQDLRDENLLKTEVYDQEYTSKEQFKADFERAIAEEAVIDKAPEVEADIPSVERERVEERRAEVEEPVVEEVVEAPEKPKPPVEPTFEERPTLEAITADMEALKEGRISIKKAGDIRSKIKKAGLPFQEMTGLEKRLGEIEAIRREKIQDKGEKSALKTIQEELESAAESLGEYKIGGDRLFALPPGINLAPAVWNGAISTMQVSLRAGAKLAHAIDMAVAFIRSQKGTEDFDEKKFRSVMEETVKEVQIPKIDRKPEAHKSEKKAEQVSDEKLKSYQEGSRDYEGLELREENWKDKFITIFQDKFTRLKVLQQAAKEKGFSITDDMNTYQKQELMVGRTKAKQDAKFEELVQSKKHQPDAVFERMKKDGVDLDNLGLFLYAKHAPERNASVAATRQAEADKRIKQLRERAENSENPEIAQRNLDKIRLIEEGKDDRHKLLPDGGSGMTNKQAEEILALVEKDGQTEIFEKYAKEIREKLITDRQNELVGYGLESKKTINFLNKKYENYVPLKVLEKQLEKATPSQKSLDVKGKEIYRAKGSAKYDFSKRVNPIIQAWADYNGTITKGEKNIVNRSFMDMVEAMPESDLFKVKKPQFRQEFDDNGEPTTMLRDFSKENEPSTLELRVDGKPILIEINDKPLVKAMKGIGVSRSIPWMVKANSYLRAVNTIYNPEFIVSNFERDVQTALINLSAEQIKGMRTKLVKSIPSAMKGIWDAERGRTDTKWSKVSNELKELGGEIGWLNMKGVEDHVNDLTKKFRQYNSDKTLDKLQGVFNSMAEYIESVNKTVEMASRTAAFKAAVDGGMSKQKAASLAKNLTVNFNRKGTITGILDSGYLFANAGIQGSARILTALKSKRVQKISAGIAAGSFALNYMNKMINEDEYNKLSDGQKERNLIIMMPNGNHVKMALPWGYNVFKVMGDMAYDVSEGNKDPGEALKSLIIATSNAFNPISSATLGQSLSPTLFDPVLQVSENKNWFGSPIVPEQKPFQPLIPESQLYFSSARPTSIATAKFINKITGGSARAAGAIDISPEIIDHYIDFAGGGLGSFVGNSVNLGVDFAKGEMPEAERIPFFRRHYGTKSDYRDLKVIYDMRGEAFRTEFSDDKQEIFFTALKSAKKEKQITEEQFDEFKEQFLLGQKMIELNRRHPNWDEEKLKDRAEDAIQHKL